MLQCYARSVSFYDNETRAGSMYMLKVVLLMDDGLMPYPTDGWMRGRSFMYTGIRFT